MSESNVPEYLRHFGWYEPHQKYIARGCMGTGRANLSGANLREADGVHLLTQTDHGYLVHATWRDEWRILAGCRDFSIAEARKHWGAADYHIPSSGSRIVALLDWLEKQPVPEEEQ